MTKQIVVLGADGMLGSMVVRILKSNPDFRVIGTTAATFNVFDFLSTPLSQWKSNSCLDHADYIVNCIGIIKPRIDESEQRSIDRAVLVNALFPSRLSQFAEDANLHVIQIATDCVFDGKEGSYLEDSPQSALDVYGKTKSLGEVKSSNVSHIRCSIVGPEIRAGRSLLEWFKGQPEGAEIKGFTNHLWNGVSTKAFADVVSGIVQHAFPLPIRVNLVPGDVVDKATLLQYFGETFKRPDIKILPVPAPVAVDRTLSTKYPSLNALLWRNAGYENPPSIHQMITDLGNLL